MSKHSEGFKQEAVHIALTTRLQRVGGLQIDARRMDCADIGRGIGRRAAG